MCREDHHLPLEPVEEPPYCDRCGSYHGPHVACPADDRGDGDDVSEFDGEPDPDDDPNLQEHDPFRDDVEADADTLRSAGYGTDEDYGYYGGPDDF